MTRIIQKCVAALLLALCLLGSGFIMAHSGPHPDGWVDVGGNVRFGETAVCALVLINGQTQFSCDGTGRYDMSVPVDGNGMITVMVFADGFAPFNQIITPEVAAEFPIEILLDQNSPSLTVNSVYEPSATEGQYVVSGTANFGAVPVCALVLANGKNMFSCSENLGQFSLEVPLDQDGNVTLMIFAAGFKPYKKITQADPDTDVDGFKDRLDEDDDNDGILDTDDACPLNSSADCLWQITDTISVDGGEWAQVYLFWDPQFATGLSWYDINAVCSSGICNGTLNHYDMNGWRWADEAEVLTLLNNYGIEPPLTPVIYDENSGMYTGNNRIGDSRSYDTDVLNIVDAFFEAGWGASFTSQYDSCPGPKCQKGRAVAGLFYIPPEKFPILGSNIESFKATATVSRMPPVFEGYMPFSGYHVGVTYNGHYGEKYVGGWFYRDP